MVFDELKDHVDQRKLEVETPYSQFESHEDEIFDGCKVVFQTTIEPLLEGELSNRQYDDELVGKFVQVVGHIQTPPMKDPFISFHIVDPAYKTLDGFNPLYGGIDDYIKYGRRNNYTEKEILQMKGKWDPSWDTSKQEEEWS